jgi:hypothetical protein
LTKASLAAVNVDGGGVVPPAVTVTVSVADEPPDALDAVSVTVYVPAASNVCDGLCVVDVPPSPKSHDQAVAPPVDVSVKLTGNGAVPDVGLAVKEAVGGVGAGDTVIV